MAPLHPTRDSEETAAPPTDATAGLPDLPTHGLLEGLACAHALVLAVDESHRVVWIHDRLGLTSGDSKALVRQPLSVLLEEIRATNAVGDERVRFFETIQVAAQEMRHREAIAQRRFEIGPDGAATSIELTAFRVHDAESRALFICYANRAAAVEELESLEQKNQELESYVRSVSHDLRSPLASLIGFAQLLRSDHGEQLPETALHFIDRIEQAGRNMERLLHDLLTLSRMGDTPQCPVHVNPRPVLEQLHAELKIQLDEQAVDLRFPDQTPTIVCDRTQLYQVFSNLIGNALRHLPKRAEGQPRGRIEIAIERANAETGPSPEPGFEISVTDNGPGIAPQDHDRIFERFQTAGRGPKSSGLGLAIVKKIVDAHGGRVWVESELGAGARFVVWLPTRRADGTSPGS